MANFIVPNLKSLISNMNKKESWKTLAHSATGVSHQRVEMPCQDAAGMLVTGQVFIGVVADGAGSAKKSEIGSKLIVEVTKAELNKALGTVKLHEFLGFRLTWSEKRAKQVFERVLRENLKALLRKADQLKCPVSELASTMIAFVVTPKWIAVVQVGDGFIAIRESGQEEYKLIFPPAKGEFANQTYFVTGKGVESRMQVCLIRSPIDFICASTDGLENVALIKAKNVLHQPFFRGLENNFRSEEGRSWLKGWLENNSALNSKTNDDKTVAIGVKIP